MFSPKNLFNTLILFFFIGFGQISAQITIAFPLERMVYQRNNSQQGYINITGNYYSNVDSIQARVTPRWSGSGTATGWVKILNTPSNGYYKGSLLANQGWYQLDVRAFSNGVAIDTATINRVGIGEVFAIAGQSNAQGGAANGFGAVDDRVNSVKFSNDYSDYNKLPLGFTQLGDNSQIAPFHYVPWAWGKLGDLLSAKLNVPVLFYGGGHGGTSSYQWRQAALGLPYDGPSWMLQNLGAPYRALLNSITFYASLTGLRGILWHQGESDPETAPLVYYDNMSYLINRSRYNAEHSTLAWVVARASLNPDVHYNVIEGQNYTIQNHPNVFAGPYTDLISGSENRTDGIHFNTTAGLIAFANAWDASLDNTFFTSSTPMMASEFIDLTVSCNPSNTSTPLTLTPGAGFSQYAWSNRQNTQAESQGISNDCCTNYTFYPPSGYEAFNWQFDSTSTISVNTGRFIMNVRKPTRKTLFSPLLHITSSPIANVPTITSSVLQVRPNDSVVLTANTCVNNWAIWSTGEIGSPKTFILPTTRTYSVQCKTPYCISSISNPITITASSCFPNALTLSGNITTAEQPYQSQASINSTQKLQSMGKIDYSALNKIELTPGFEANAGSVFKATIQGCN